MKKWLIILLLFPFSCIAQIYKYIGVEDILSKKTGKDICGFSLMKV